MKTFSGLQALLAGAFVVLVVPGSSHAEPGQSDTAPNVTSGRREVGRRLRDKSELLSDFAYRDVRIGLRTMRGKPVPGASIYGFCPDFNLIWPNTDRKGTRKDRRQDDLPWQEAYLGKTDQHGDVAARIPPGKWAFFACGCWPEHGRNRRIVAACSDYVELRPGSQAILRPAVRKSWSFQASDTGPLRHKRFFLKPDHLPIWIPVDVPLGPKMTFEIPNQRQMELWSEGDHDRNNPAFALHWGKFSSETPDGKREPAEAPAHLDVRGGRGRASVSWFRHGGHGLTGQIRFGDPESVLLSPGEYSLGYTRPVNQSVMAEFVARYYHLQPETTQPLHVDTDLTAGLAEGAKVACLFIVDKNGHLLRRFLTRTGQGAPCRAGLWLDGRMHAVDPTPSGRTLFEIPEKLRREKTGGLVREWTFGLPVTLSRENRFVAQPMTILSSDHFWTSVPAVLESPMVNFLEQADRFEDRMREVSQRTKRAIPRTRLSFPVRRGGASATHFGTRITLPSDLLYQDAAVLDHAFGHELGHNFDLYHGGLHELIVERTRCAGGAQITGQISMWFFMDRMNGIEREETWRPPTGLYVYCYSRDGLDFLRFVSHYENSIREAMTKEGFSNEAVTAALCEVALDRDLFDVGCRYGLCSARSRHVAAVKAVRELIAAATPPQPARDPRQIMSDPPGWIALSGKWRQKGEWLTRRRARGSGKNPRLVRKEMPRAPFSVSFSMKNVEDSLDYVRLDVCLSASQYSFVIEDERVHISGPGDKGAFAREFTFGEDDICKPQVSVNEKEVTFVLDGKQIHSAPRTDYASQGSIYIYGANRRTSVIADFRVTEHK